MAEKHFKMISERKVQWLQPRHVPFEQGGEGDPRDAGGVPPQAEGAVPQPGVQGDPGGRPPQLPVQPGRRQVWLRSAVRDAALPDGTRPRTTTATETTTNSTANPLPVLSHPVE